MMGAGTGTTPANMAGTAGLDIFALATKTISGWYHSFKAAPDGVPMQPFASLLEHMLGMYLEYHPHVRTYQRGDASVAFAAAWGLAMPLGTPYALGYELDGKARHYLPDFVGRFQDGGLLVAEAGVEEAKTVPEALAKAAAGRRWAAIEGGAYWIGTEENLARQRHENWVFLHARRLDFPAYSELNPHLLARLAPGNRVSVRSLVAEFGDRWTPKEVEGAAWKLAAEAACAGRLLVDLAAAALDLDSELALLPPHLPPIVPDPLPDTLAPRPATPETDRSAEAGSRPLPGPAVDPEQIPEKYRARFLRNLHAVLAVIGGKRIDATAEHFGMSASGLRRLVARAQDPRHGELALWPYKTYAREGRLHPAFLALIRKLYTGPNRPGPTAIWESPELAELARSLAERGRRTVPIPDYWQIYACVRKLERDPDAVSARVGLPRPRRGLTTTRSFVLSLPAAGHCVQFDEHYLKVTILARDGVTVLARCAHAAAAICAKTGAILGATLSLAPLREEDYLCLVKQTMEDKDAIARRARCKHRWSCKAKPSVALHDRGPIFISKHATDVVVGRFQIVEERAPAYAPEVKGTVEALFSWVVRKFSQRLPLASRRERVGDGALDVALAARESGLTFDLLEELFYQAIVDDYMQDFDPLRGQRRCDLWDDAVERHGVPQWLGSSEALTLLLLRRANPKNSADGTYRVHPGKGIAIFHGTYVNPTILRPLAGQDVAVFYDRRDIAVIYLFQGGVKIGEAYCRELQGALVTEWEASAEHARRRVAAKAAATATRESRRETQRRARTNKRDLQADALRREEERERERKREGTHPEHVLQVLRAMREEGGDDREEAPQVSLLPAPEAHDQERPERAPTFRSRVAG